MTDKPMKLDNDDVMRIIEHKRKVSLGSENSEIMTNWSEAMDRYHGRPYGDEQEGFSSIVTKDLSERIDLAMPILMRILLQSGNIAEFIPTSSRTEDIAKMQSDYANYVFMKDNDGFLVAHDAVKDALILQNGYIKTWYDVQTKVKQRKYTNVTQEGLLRIQNYWKLEKKATSIDFIERGEEVSGVFESLTLKITLEEKKVSVEAVPPEELNISGNCRGYLEGADFVEHKPKKTRSALIEMGLPKKWVNGLPASKTNTNTISEARNQYSDEDDPRKVSIDRSLDDMDYYETYILIDVDGDGVSELRRIVSVNGEIPIGDEWNEPIDFIPISGGSPKRIPHRHKGESFYDDLKDLIEINTILERQLMDNVYRSVNSEWIINKNCHLPDWQTSVPGGFRRTTTNNPVSQDAMQSQVTPIAQHLLPVISHIQERTDNRASINGSSQGIDPDVLKQGAGGAIMESISLAAQKGEMVARLLAETLFKPAVHNIIRFSIKHQDFKRTVQITGNDVEIDPMTWDDDLSISVRVGIGSGNGQERHSKLMILSAAQDKLKAAGLIGPEEEYSLFSDIAKAIGEETPEKYAINPETPQYQQNKQYIMGLAAKAQQQGNPLAEAEKIKGEYAVQIKQMQESFNAQVKQMQESNKSQIAINAERHKHEMEILRMEREAENKERDRQAKALQDHLDRQHEKAMTIFKEEMENMRADKPIDIAGPGIGAEMS